MSSTTKLSDIDEILAKSQRLTTHASLSSATDAATGAGFSAAGWRFMPSTATFNTATSGTGALRAVSELAEASKRWTAGGTTATATSNTAQQQLHQRPSFDAMRLLSNHDYDAKKVYDEVNSIHLKTADDSSEQLEGTDIEGYLAHHHDLIILAAVEEARLGAEEHVQEMQRRWAASEWSHARNQFMESLGHRAYKWEGLDGSSSSTTAAAVATTAPFSGFTTQADLMRQRQGLMFSPGSAVAGSSQTPMKQLLLTDAATTAVTATAAVNMPPLSGLLQAQSRVVREMNSASHAEYAAATEAAAMNRTAATTTAAATIAAAKPYSALARAIQLPSSSVLQASAVVSDGLSKSDLTAYKQHLLLLAHMTAEIGVTTTTASNNSSSALQQPLPAGFFSAICFDVGDIVMNHNASENRKQLLTIGAKTFFESQIFDVWSQQLDAAVMRDGWQLPQSNARSSRRQRLRSFVSMLFHCGQLPNSCRRAMCTASTDVAAATTVAAAVESPVSPRAGRHDVFGSGSHRQQQLQLQQQQHATPLWAFIYHCIRAGELSAAMDELTSCLSQRHSDDGEAAALAVLKSIALVNSTTTAFSGSKPSRSQSSSTAAASCDPLTALTETNWANLREHLFTCRAQFEQEMSAEESSFDPFRATVFNLLGLVDRESLASTGIPGFNIEDFLWSHLWFIQQMRSLQPAVGSRSFVSGISSPTGGSAIVAKTDKCRESDLFELVLEYGGEDYFDQDRTAPFRYAMVLSCCQRFGDAIAHLWGCNKLLPAVHLTAVALHYGLLLPHPPLCCNPPHAMQNGRRFLAGGNTGLAQEPTPAAILQSFVSSPLLQCHPDVCVDYLVSLDSHWLQQSKECGLADNVRDANKVKSQSVVGAALEVFLSSLDKQRLSEVVGIPVDDQYTAAATATAAAVVGTVRGSPRTSGGRLDFYLSADQISRLLSHAAHQLATQRGETEAAMYLYLLAGRYNEVIEELCSQLCKTLVPQSYRSQYNAAAATAVSSGSQVATDRSYWRSISDSFIERYLQRGEQAVNSQLMYTMMQSSNRDAVDALILLNKLFEFADVAVGNSDSSTAVTAADALNFLDHLNVLPAHQNQVNEYSPLLNSYCRSVIDDVLVMAADLTGRAFAVLKLERAQGSAAMTNLTTDKDLRMRALKERAQGLVAFAHRIKLRLNRQETPGVIEHIESSLI